MRICISTVAAIFLLSGCSNTGREEADAGKTPGSQQAGDMDAGAAAKLLPAMYDFKNNPDRDAHNVASDLVANSQECVGHFRGAYKKLFFVYEPSSKTGTISAYTQGGDRYQESFEAHSDDNTMKVMLPDGSPAAEILEGVRDNTLFDVTSLFKDKSGDIVLYAGNWYPAPRGIMQSRTVEMYCGAPQSEEWKQKVDKWRNYASTLQDTNFMYI